MTTLLVSPLPLVLLLLAVTRGMPTTHQPPQQDDTAASALLPAAAAPDAPAATDLVDEPRWLDEPTVIDSVRALETDETAATAGNETEAGGVDDIYKTVRDHAEVVNAGRDKERRLEVIRALILNTTGRTERPHSAANGGGPSNSVIKDLKSILESMMPVKTPDGYTEKVQSFYPICMPPRAGSEQANHDEREGMNLFFNLSYPTPLEGSEINVVSAKLKLYKLSQVNQSSPANVVCAPRRTVDTSALEAAAAAAAAAAAGTTVPIPLPIPPVPTEPYVEDDRRVRVSVYSYFYHRGQKKNRLRRRLQDTKMVSVSGDGWVELNVRAAARLWRNASKNLGLLVEVEDEEGKLLPTSRFFSDMNCSKEAAASRPIPSFLFDAARERHGHENTSLQYSPDLFPVIDLCTMDVPKPEIKPMPPVPSSVDLNAKHSLGGEATSVLLMPYSTLSDLARKRNEATPEDDDDEALDGGKNTSEQAHPAPLHQREEEEHVVPEQRHHQPLAELPALTETQNEQPTSLHPHRHHRHQHHRSHEETSPEWSQHHDDDVSESREEPEETDDEWAWPKRHTHGLHHRYHHQGHRFHGVALPSGGSAEDWSEESRRLVVVPASELLALSEHLEREEARVNRQLAHNQRRADELER